MGRLSDGFSTRQCSLVRCVTGSDGRFGYLGTIDGCYGDVTARKAG